MTVLIAPTGSRTHKQRVLDLLSDGRPHHHHELYALHVVAHSRVSDLRADGHNIVQWRDGDLYFYRLLVEGAIPAGEPDTSLSRVTSPGDLSHSRSSVTAEPGTPSPNSRPLTRAGDATPDQRIPALVSEEPLSGRDGEAGWAGTSADEPRDSRGATRAEASDTSIRPLSGARAESLPTGSGGSATAQLRLEGPAFRKREAA